MSTTEPNEGLYRAASPILAGHNLFSDAPVMVWGRLVYNALTPACGSVLKAMEPVRGGDCLTETCHEGCSVSVTQLWSWSSLLLPAWEHLPCHTSAVKDGVTPDSRLKCLKPGATVSLSALCGITEYKSNKYCPHPGSTFQSFSVFSEL